ncbi:HAMP domain-containing sensor histidine kinase [Parvibaculaceae bacterium PLY_AMNH_Bact1]|nr:HAMP domain-containing sensor histidine kinase [Parvibaculaceae bacterium PLY_AMNH_Bact1]
MSTVLVESQAERDQGIRDVVRTITLAGLVTISAAAYDFYSSGLPDDVPAFQFFQVGTLIVLLTSVVVASWLGLVASSRLAIGLIYGFISLFLLSVVANLLFVVEAPMAVERYTPWIIATLIIPFLTAGRSFARALGGTFVLSMLLLVGAHVLRVGANPFTEPCCADLILFCLALIVAFVLLDGFAMFREAAIKFHARSDALAEHAAEMRQAFEEAEKAREQSEIARKEAEKSIKLRETFLATMSHELRTPLNAIIGFSEVMKSDALGNGDGATEQYRTYAEDIHQSGEHVLGLINQLLEYSRIRSGTFDLNPTELQLAEVVQFIHRMSLSTAKAKGVELGIQIASDCDRPVRADRQALIQIGLNLVGNALKFTDPGGRVTLRVTSGARGQASLQVIDTGAGIPADKIEEVCQPFVRLGDASLASETGTGLGLAIIKALADAMGTPFTLESEEGKGTAATLSLSLVQPKALSEDVPGVAAE